MSNLHSTWIINSARKIKYLKEGFSTHKTAGGREVASKIAEKALQQKNIERLKRNLGESEWGSKRSA